MTSSLKAYFDLAIDLDSNAEVNFAENGTGVVYNLRAGIANAGALYFELAEGSDDKLFNLDANSGLLSFKAAPDFELPHSALGSNSYHVKLRVVDVPTGRSKIQSVAVKVSDVNEAPTALTLSNTVIAENIGVGPGVAIAEINLNDPDAAAVSNVLRLSGADAVSFEIRNLVLST